MSFDSTESKLVVYYETDGAIWAPERPDYEAFFKAVTAGILADVKTALNAHIEINAMHGHGEDGETALHMASAAGHVDIVEYLIANGAIVDSHDIGQHGPSRPLHDAAFFGRARVVEVLLNNGADITALGEQGGTVIQQVLRSEKRVEPRHIETIVLLLDRGHDIHSGAIELGGTVLHQAAELGSIELIQILLDRGADINIDSPNCPESVLKTVAAYGNCDTANFLIEHGAKNDEDVLERASSTDIIELLTSHNDYSRLTKCGALHAHGRGDGTLVACLLDKGFKVDAIDSSGDTPLLSACGVDRPSPEVVALLLRNGADIAARTARSFIHIPSIVKGDTPLHRATYRSDPAIVELLLQAGADLTIKNASGQTPLHKFASDIDGFCCGRYTPDGEQVDHRMQVLNMLIDAGADVNTVDIRNRTCLHALADCSRRYAQKPRRAEAAKLLLAAGVALEAVDSDGRTALELFSNLKDQAMVKLLSSYCKYTAKNRYASL